MKNNNKDLKFYSLLLVGTVLTIIGLFLPPLGALSESLIIIISQLTLLVAALYEVSLVLDFKNMFFCIGRYPKQLKEEKETDKQKENPSEQQ
jgi:hypothetical protein